MLTLFLVQFAVVFSICLGNVGAHETITINLWYMSPLIDDEEKDQIRFTVPRVYMQRWGTAPTPGVVQSRSIKHEDVPFTMDIICQQAGAIGRVACLSEHSFDHRPGKPRGASASNIPDANFATFKIKRTGSSSGPSADVVLVIAAKNLDAPRAFIERHCPSGQAIETCAMKLTLVPTLQVVYPGMEYILLVDRGASMEGIKIERMRDAVVHLLKGLPSDGTVFNIFSFANEVTPMWPESKPYVESTRDEAIRQVK